MAQVKKTSYASLEELRADKVKLRKSVIRCYEAAKRDSVDCFLPSSNQFFSSSSSYMHYAGYAITAYKTFKTVKKIATFIAKLKKR